MSKIAPYIAAAVQWTPCVHDPKAGAQKAARAIAEAAGKGARLIVFPETFLQGYPYFTGLPGASPEFQAWLHALHAGAIDRNSEMKRPGVQSTILSSTSGPMGSCLAATAR